MPKVDTPILTKPISAKRRYGMRTMALSEQDPQIKALIPDETIREKALVEGLTLDRIMGVFLDGYADRPCMGERAYRVVEEESTKKKVRQYLPLYQTITYRESHCHGLADSRSISCNTRRLCDDHWIF